MAKVRVTRTLVYEGDEKWVRGTLSKSMKGTWIMGGQGCKIHSSIEPGEFSDLGKSYDQHVLDLEKIKAEPPSYACNPKT